MKSHREVMQQALSALEYHTQQTRPIHNTELAIEALREALSRPEPEPVTKRICCGGDGSPYAPCIHPTGCVLHKDAL